MKDKIGPDGLYDYQRRYIELVLNKIAENEWNEWNGSHGVNIKDGPIPEEMMIGVKRLGHSMQGTTCIICGWQFAFPMPRCTVIEGEVIK